MDKVKNKSKSNNKPNKNKIAIVSIIVLFILLYFINSIIKLIQQPTDIFTISNGSLLQEESVVGYVIRDETVVKGNNYKNGMIQIKAEGERVSKGDSIFRYYTNNEEELIKKIEELDIQIQDAMEKDTGIFSSDIKLLETQIEEKINEATNNIFDIQKINEYKKDINTKLTKKSKIAGDLNPSSSYIRKLIEKRSSYENQLNSGTEYISAPNSGVVSYRVDGLEEVLTPNSFSSLNKNMLENLKLKTGQIVATSDESGKIINNFEAYIVVSMNSDEAKNAVVGDSVKLRLATNEETTANIEYIAEDEDSRLIVFKINNEVESLIDYRKISLDVIWWSYSGLKVPNSAILEENGMNYIVRNRTGYTDKILIKVLKQNSSYSIIGNYSTEELKKIGYDSSQIIQVKIHDEIVLKPTK